ncbi:hypothetical protein [Streptomyces lancefieldiae]|uniref:Uncharacterized protein n=1 Tax=Streptomyces lancefieldiae TaxID=3075520 RepID=A0ABU3AVB7_9ACTN|nr:hypothetical protein [Streptomyces sp. DSM 40712]MDT0614141.1 hypothetical protein [Streptomyces sp. DSM 40712]
MNLSGSDGQYLVAYYAEVGTPDHDAMVLLDGVAQDRAAGASAPESPVRRET